ncbi:MAG: S8 family serine peptidase, partial [Alphaproteobacteria bacterium]
MTRNAFVINNSWGYPWNLYDIRSSLNSPGEPYYFHLPNFFLAVNSAVRLNLHQQIFDVGAIAAWERAVANDTAIVFAAGNDGWNSETGEHKTFSKGSKGRNWTDYRFDEFKYRRTVPRQINLPDGSGRFVDVPANIPALESSYFLTNRKLRGSWLAVVNVNRQNIIHWSSNGCGIAKDYCLAAPGTDIKSTFVRGEKQDDGDETHPNPDGDVDDKAGDGYGTNSGTSMAAPMVSGALAVLKSKHPRMTARQAVKAVLCTATDLDKSTGRPAKSIEECADKGPEATHANGWTPSEVYGHGLLNLARALRPIGPTRAAAAGAFGVAAAADTRVAFSSAFGNAAPSQELDFGGLDMFGRVYRFRAPLQDRVMPGPRLAGVMAMTAAPPPVVMGRGEGVTTLLRRSTNVDSAIGEGGVVSYLGARSRTDLALVNRRTGAALSPAALLRQGDDVAPVWESLAPQARDIIGASSDWQMAPNLHAGVFFSRATVAAATQRGESYSVRDYGVSSRVGSRAGGVEARLGRMNENGRFLGSRPEGGYALARPTRSDYLRLRASHRLAPGVSVGAEWLRLRARVDFRHDGFVRDMALDARAAGVHLAADDLARDGDRLVLHYGEPLAVTGGVMRQTSVTGYTSSGAYRATTRDLDLAVRKRHRMAQMVYQRPLGGRVSGFAAAAHHRNWSHQGGLTNNLV